VIRREDAALLLRVLEEAIAGAGASPPGEPAGAES